MTVGTAFPGEELDLRLGTLFVSTRADTGESAVQFGMPYERGGFRYDWTAMELNADQTGYVPGGTGFAIQAYNRPPPGPREAIVNCTVRGQLFYASGEQPREYATVVVYRRPADAVHGEMKRLVLVENSDDPSALE